MSNCMNNQMKVVVIDGQGGRIGQLLVEKINEANLDIELVAVGTNTLATSVMLKAGAVAGATGENPVVVACRDADVILGPIGIIAADSLMGEITEKMANAVSTSRAVKLLLPWNLCDKIVVGVSKMSMNALVQEAVEQLKSIVTKE